LKTLDKSVGVCSIIQDPAIYKKFLPGKMMYILIFVHVDAAKSVV